MQKNLLDTLASRKKGRVGIGLFGWSRMALVGKPMAKSKWVGVELISSSSEKGSYLVRANLFFCKLCLCLNVNFVARIGSPLGSFIIIIDFIIHTHVAPSIMHTKYYHSSVLFFFPLLLAMQFVTFAN